MDRRKTQPRVKDKNKSRLTAFACDNAKPEDRPYKLSDGDGLYMLVAPTGGKSWRWNYRFEAAQKTMIYGAYPALGLGEVRRRHAGARELLDHGLDPVAGRKEALAEERKAEVIKTELRFTVRDLYLRWINWWKANKAERYVRQTEKRIETDVLPRFGDMEPDALDRLQVVALIQSIGKEPDPNGHRTRPAPVQAGRILNYLDQMYEWGLDNGLVKNNPASGVRVKRIVNQHVVENFKALPIREVPMLLAAMRKDRCHQETGIAHELLALTFLRTSELLLGRWDEINWKETLWEIPKERMKGEKGFKRPHLVPLAKQTVILLKRLYERTGDHVRMWPHEGNVAEFDRNLITSALNRMGYKGRMTGHGWRRIASTYLAEHSPKEYNRGHGFDAKYIEMQSHHLVGNDVSRVYNKAEYLKERRDMMQFWADELDRLREQGMGRILLVQKGA